MSQELLFTLLSRQFLPEKFTDKPTKIRHTDSFKPLIQHIEATIGEAISVEKAANMVNLNPYYFCKIFKKITGRTFVDFVNWMRLNEADRLLRETEWTLAEIAERIGCGNANYFTKLYKKYKCNPPSDVRRKG